MKKKFIIFVAVIAALALMIVYDYYMSTQYILTVTSIDPQPAQADGNTPVTLKVNVMHNKKPVEGHDIYGIVKDGGSFQAYRLKSDANGEVVFTYFPYMASDLQKAEDVNVQFFDQSNSVFVEINATTKTVIKLVEPKKSTEKSEFNTDEIFGEDSSDETTQEDPASLNENQTGEQGGGL